MSFKLGTFHGVTYDVGDTFTANTQVYYATASDVVRDINEANIPYVTAEAVLSTTNPAKYVYPNVVGGIPAPGTHTNFLRLKHYYLKLIHPQYLYYFFLITRIQG